MVLPIRSTVDGIVAGWLRRHGLGGIDLVVAHTHSHGDHVFWDEQFASRPRTKVVEPTPSGVSRFFGLPDWPHEQADVHVGVLGSRIEMTSTPRKPYPVPTIFQPDEHPPPLTVAHVKILHAACEAVRHAPRRDVHEDFCQVLLDVTLRDNGGGAAASAISEVLSCHGRNHRHLPPQAL